MEETRGRDRRAALVYNPMAGRRKARLGEAVAAALAEEGWQVEVHPTDAPGGALPLARQLAAGGVVDTVFALGGDGTLREVAEGLLGTEVALAPLPGGTTNVFVRSLGLPADPVAAARIAAACPPRPICVGTCNGRPFLMMVSLGFDAAVVAAMDGGLKARWGQLGVAWTGVPAWWRYRYRAVGVEGAGPRAEAPYVAVCNIPHYGGPWCLAPGACCDEASLEIVLFRRPGRLASLSFLRDLARGRHQLRPDVEIRRAEGELLLDGPADVPIQIDGDRFVGGLPLSVGIAPRPLAVLAPAVAARNPDERPPRTAEPAGS